MANKLTTKDLESVVVSVLPNAVSETSVLSKAGANNISYNTDILRRTSFGGPSAVFEGEVKPGSDIGLSSISVKKFKLVHKFVETEEFENTEEGRAIAAESLKLAVSSLIKGSDVAILNGTSPATGTAVDDFADVNLKDNATSITAAAETVTDDDFLKILRTNNKVSAVLLGDDGFASIAYAKNDFGRVYPDANQDGFQFWSKPAYYSSAVSLNGWNASTEIKNDVLAYAGDFTKISRSYGLPEVRKYDQAIFDGVNLAETNQIGYIIEVPLAFAIETPGKFTALKKTA